jgi:hypothetical protein
VLRHLRQLKLHWTLKHLVLRLLDNLPSSQLHKGLPARSQSALDRLLVQVFQRPCNYVSHNDSRFVLANSLGHAKKRARTSHVNGYDGLHSDADELVTVKPTM